MEEKKDVAHKPCNYANKEFWDNRFKETSGTFDWYISWDELKAEFLESFPPDKTERVLTVGCGNSQLAEQMYESGYKKIMNIDISEVVIEKMRKQYEALSPGVEWEAMDATNMSFPSDTFDLVIDKGTYDALVCGEDKTVPLKLIDEMIRVARKQAILITYGAPEKRMKEFQKCVRFKEVKIESREARLSDLSQFINLLRSGNSKKSITETLKDKEFVRKAVQEIFLIKKEEELLKSKDKKQQMIGLMLRARRKKEEESPKEAQTEAASPQTECMQKRQDHVYIYTFAKSAPIHPIPENP